MVAKEPSALCQVDFVRMHAFVLSNISEARSFAQIWARRCRVDARSFPRKMLFSRTKLVTTLSTRSGPWVLPIHHVLDIAEDDWIAGSSFHEGLASHLVRWSPGDGEVLFIAHAWEATSHPDPQGDKLRLLKKLLSRMQPCKLNVQPNTATIDSGGAASLGEAAFLWMDMISIPRHEWADRQRAVRSLVGYATESSQFLVLSSAWDPCKDLDKSSSPDDSDAENCTPPVRKGMWRTHHGMSV